MSEKNPILKTPVGVLKFPEVSINGKDVFYIENKETTEEDNYKVSFAVAFDPVEGAEILDIIREKCDGIKNRNYETIKKDYEKDPDSGEKTETGKVLINFKSYYPAKIVDAKKQPLEVGVGWGSKCRIAFICKETNDKKNKKYGITCYVKSIQVIELQQSGDVSSVFDEEEGYTINAQESQSTTTNAETVDWEE